MTNPTATVMQSIPTLYRGYRFRSRLEATWARFFDAMGWRWEYEPFDMPGWIPDFVIYGADHVLVEVKPIGEPDEAVQSKITTAAREGEWTGELLVLGTGPFVGQWESFCLGWLGERVIEGEPFGWTFDQAVLGTWSGSESEAKNPKRTVGFCHETQGFRDRITGCYDGGCQGDVGSDGLLEDLQRLWAQAKNETQWRSPQ